MVRMAGMSAHAACRRARTFRVRRTGLTACGFALAFALAPDIRPALAQAGAQQAGAQQAGAQGETMVLTIVVTRHGVRAMTPPPPPPAPPTPYKWADWSPVGPDELTGHGYRMMRRMGEFYRD